MRASGRPVRVYCPAMKGHRPGRRTVDGVDVVYFRSVEGKNSIGVVFEGLWNTITCTARALLFRPTSVRSVQVCNPPDTLFSLLVLCRAKGITTIYDQHDVAPAMASMRPGLRRLRWFFEWCERLTVASADVVVTSSQSQQERLRRLFGTEALLVRSATASLRRSERGSNERCRIGYLGVIGAQEGLDDLVDAVAAATSEGLVDLEVVVAGDGPYLAQLRQRTTALGLDGIISYTGWLSGDRLADFLASIDAMVVTDPESEYNHHCAMNKVLEAMAQGIPVVMRPLRENHTLTGDHRWVTTGWSIDELAAAILDFASATSAERRAEGRRLSVRYRDLLDWDGRAEQYVRAVSARGEQRSCSTTEPSR